ncbi:MAG: type II toxin-antitoxin system HicA family toxin [Candidatus Aquicultor sp.]
MTKPPHLSGKEIIKALERAGYSIDRQRGSHVILMHATRPRISVPNHKSVKPGTLRAIIKQTGFTVDEFEELL